MVVVEVGLNSFFVNDIPIRVTPHLLSGRAPKYFQCSHKVGFISGDGILGVSWDIGRIQDFSTTLVKIEGFFLGIFNNNYEKITIYIKKTNIEIEKLINPKYWL